MKIKKWAFGPFVKNDKPILEPDKNSNFVCPVSNKKVFWEYTNVYNPAAIVKDGAVHIVYRADDITTGQIDRYGNKMVVCRLGHAVSRDGINFVRDEKPVLYPDNDQFRQYEWDGGCQDLHIVESEDGTYYMNYTAWTGSYDIPEKECIRDVLMVACSKDRLTGKNSAPLSKTEPSKTTHVRERLSPEWWGTN